MKIVFLCNQFPYPPISGMRRKVLTLVKYLKKEGNKIYLFSLTSPEREFKNDVFEEIKVAKKIKFIKKIFNCFKKFLKKPIQISIYTSSKNIKDFRNYIKFIKPDLIFVDYIRSADYSININLPKMINYDDPQSLKFKRMEPYLKEIKNPFGEGMNFLPSFWRKIFLISLFKKIILKYEIYTLKRYEREISKYYDLVFTNSFEDAEYLKKNGVKNIKLFPPLIDKEFYKYENIEKKNVIIFVGKMDYSPNPHAVLYFTKKILPEIEKIYQDPFEFKIIGANTPSWMFKLQNEKIKVLGEVEDIRPYLSESKVFVAPLKFGTGIKVKIIEAMALGVPVVTTSVGVQGISVKNGVHLFVEDDPKNFAKYVVELLKDEDLRKRIAENARNYVFENFDAENYVKNYFLNKIIQQKI
ncbi:MAG: glycosyltransferase [candidate division WOR-3 bacterium]